MTEMTPTRIAGWIKAEACPCVVVGRLAREGLENVTTSQVEVMLISLKNEPRFEYTGEVIVQCEKALYNFFHRLKEKKGDDFFEKLKPQHQVEVDLILQGGKCLK
jgi:hypothetical protein